MRITRRHLQVGLGLLWLLDGALQFQPYMFGKAFALTELAPAGVGQPGVVSHPVHWAAQIVVGHPALTDTGFALVQTALGIGLLLRRSARAALAASVVWGVAVWWLGEGLGGLTTGETLLTGAPGAALLYALIACFAFPDRRGSSSIAPSRWAIPAWSALWFMGVGMQLAAGNNTGKSFSSMFRDSAPDASGWIASLDTHLSHVHFANGFVAGLIALEVVIAMWAFVPGAVQRLSFGIGTAVALAAWLLVQGLGDLTTGQATDPNSGPLIALLAIAAYGAAQAQNLRSPMKTSNTASTVTRSAVVLGSALALTVAGSTAALDANASANAHASTSSKTLHVVESDYHIALSTHSGSAGTVTIVDKNISRQRHGLVFNGPGLDNHLVFYVKAHSTKTATITLRKGKYDVYCPVPGHKMLGMNTHFTVS